MVEAAPMADGQTKDRMRFMARQMVDAMAPSNFLATNPEFVKTALETKGLSIQQGHPEPDRRPGKRSHLDDRRQRLRGWPQPRGNARCGGL
jgi:polyhydroxyalkanoate synthase